MPGLAANLVEVFYSLQGEGVHAGKPFAFVRFAGCNLACGYCDTPASRDIPAAWSLRRNFDDPGERRPNPAASADVSSALRSIGCRNVSFTGGEPLLQAAFVEEIAMELEGLFLQVETNGSLPERLTPGLTGRIDHWSVDWKLPSACGFDATERTKEFLRVLEGAASVSVKAVFDESTPGRELREVFAFAESYAPGMKDFSLVFQPVTKDGRAEVSRAVLGLLPSIEKAGFDVRILPQIHKFLNVP